MKRWLMKVQLGNKMLIGAALVVVVSLAEVPSETSWRRFVDYFLIVAMSALIILSLVNRRRQDESAP